MRILVADPDEGLFRDMRQLPGSAITALGYVSTVAQITESLNRSEYDALLLSFDLPDRNGLDLIRSIRRWTIDLPLLVVSWHGATEIKIDALVAGADDYVVRPCQPAELVARLQAIGRRSLNHPCEPLELGGLRLDPASRTASLQGRPILLAAREYDVLELLMIRRDEIVSKQALLRHLYADSAPSQGEVLRVFIYHLRRKLEQAGSAHAIKTCRGQGYMLSEAPALGPDHDLLWQADTLHRAVPPHAAYRLL